MRENGIWRDRVKLSEEVAKTSCPGVQQTRRMYHTENGQMVGDMVFDQTGGIRCGGIMYVGDIETPIGEWQAGENLLAYRARSPSLEFARSLCQKDLSRLPSGVKRLQNPDTYPVGLEANLYRARLAAIERVRVNHVEVQSKPAA
jgi:nicotinate phosphoribosyltransferase